MKDKIWMWNVVFSHSSSYPLSSSPFHFSKTSSFDSSSIETLKKPEKISVHIPLNLPLVLPNPPLLLRFLPPSATPSSVSGGSLWSTLILRRRIPTRLFGTEFKSQGGK